jgi:hypothetical protein
MKGFIHALIVAAVALIFESATDASGQTVTLESLLTEMTNRDAAAQWPDPAYVCKQVSSHDPRKNNPSDPAGWHSNVDYGNFIRIETNQDRKEWVILDAQGAGANTRIWVPLNADDDKQIVRFYFDGSTQPAITANFNELLSGKSFIRPPLAFVSWNETDLHNQLKPDFKAPRGVGGDSYLPVPFARSCKVTLDQVPFYYCINYRSYAPNVSVKTFAMTDYEAIGGTINQVGATLLDKSPAIGKILSKEEVLAPGKELALDLPKGSKSVRDLQVHVLPGDAPGVLRTVVVEANFDGESTVWCPLSEFFGVGARLHAVNDWYRDVSGSGDFKAQWVMPYRRNGKVILKNLGDKPVQIGLSATTGPWKWNDRSLHFHANWRCQLGMKTRPMFDWNYIDIKGQGVYVGDSLTVFSPVPNWYGEGDERIYTDGEQFPFSIGTGTEDYYGYAWGMPNYFNSPFISTPERDSKAREDWRGYTTDSRLRLLDGIPFRSGLKHDMEIWNWADTQVDYAVGTFWYARPSATDNRLPQTEEARASLKEFSGK